jgi:hypothetical protein
MKAHLNLKLSPIPADKKFAITFVDDTDLSTRENTEPVYEYLDSHNVRGTKTVWISRQKRNSIFRKDREKVISGTPMSGATLEDPDYLQFVRNLATMGFEIALHGISAGNSYRNEIIDGIELFRSYFGRFPRINIFHEKNIENLYCGRHKLDLWPLRVLERFTDNSDYQGQIDGSPYFWGDIAKQTIDYMRLPFHTLQEVNTFRINPSMPFYDPLRPYVNGWFASSDGADCHRFNRLLSRENIDKLVRERGACVVYTHFAKNFTRPRVSAWILADDFRRTVDDLTYREGGWFPTASDLLDRFRDFQAIRIEQYDKKVILINQQYREILKVAVLAEPGIVITDEHGVGYEADASGIINVPVISPWQKLIFLCNHRIKSKLWTENRVNNIRRERRIIELKNYVGLLRG